MAKSRVMTNLLTYAKIDLWGTIHLMILGCMAMPINTRVRRFFESIDRKIFRTINHSVRVLRPHFRNFKANDFKHYCAAACVGTYQAHM